MFELEAAPGWLFKFWFGFWWDEGLPGALEITVCKINYKNLLYALEAESNFNKF